MPELFPGRGAHTCQYDAEGRVKSSTCAASWQCRMYNALGNGSGIIRARLVRRMEDRHWRRVREFSGALWKETARHSTLPIHRVLQPPEGRTRI
jgi:hypothetical protein